MSGNNILERRLAVFCNWAVFGFIGIGFLLESLALDDYLISLIGIFGIIGGFVGNMVINVLFKQPFTDGETAFGLGVFGLVVLFFILGWVFTESSRTDFFIGLTLVSVILLGFFAYVFNRFGVRSSFSSFHFNSASPPEDRE